MGEVKKFLIMKKLLCVLVFPSIIADAQTRNGKTMLAGKSVYAEFLSPKFVFYERDNWVEDLQIWATMFLPYLSLGYAF